MKIRRLDNPRQSFDLHFSERSYDVVGLGSNSVDQLCIIPQYPHPDSKIEILHYERLPGGQTATATIFLSRMGLKAKYIGKVGGDEIGCFSLESLRAEAIDTSKVLLEHNARTQHAIIIIDQQTGERTIFYQHDPNLDFDQDELSQEDVCCGRILHIDGYDSNTAIRAASWCQQEGIYVSADLDKVIPGCEELITKVDFLITSANFPSEFTGISDPIDSMLELGRRFNGFLAVTLGAQGAMALVGNRCLTFPALKVKTVDTTGAGDIFHGGFLYGLLQNWPLEMIMAFANAAAGLSCGYLGARTGIRPLNEILQAAKQIVYSAGTQF